MICPVLLLMSMLCWREQTYRQMVSINTFSLVSPGYHSNLVLKRTDIQINGLLYCFSCNSWLPWLPCFEEEQTYRKMIRINALLLSLLVTMATLCWRVQAYSPVVSLTMLFLLSLLVIMATLCWRNCHVIHFKFW